jgi:hypothetical protein
VRREQSVHADLERSPLGYPCGYPGSIFAGRRGAGAGLSSREDAVECDDMHAHEASERRVEALHEAGTGYVDRAGPTTSCLLSVPRADDLGPA